MSRAPPLHGRYLRTTDRERPASASATLGPGATNLVTGLADANMDRSPTGVPSSGRPATTRLHMESHQNMDAIAMIAAHLQVGADHLRRRERSPEVVRKAFKIAEMEKPGASRSSSCPRTWPRRKVDERAHGRRRGCGVRAADHKAVKPRPSTSSLKAKKPADPGRQWGRAQARRHGSSGGSRARPGSAWSTPSWARGRCRCRDPHCLYTMGLRQRRLQQPRASTTRRRGDHRRLRPGRVRAERRGTTSGRQARIIHIDFRAGGGRSATSRSPCSTSRPTSPTRCGRSTRRSTTASTT